MQISDATKDAIKLTLFLACVFAGLSVLAKTSMLLRELESHMQSIDMDQSPRRP